MLLELSLCPTSAADIEKQERCNRQPYARQPKSFDEEEHATYNDARMRIGLLSDTHILKDEEKLSPEVMEAFRGVDLILHGGDIYVASVLDDLECIAPVLAAKGDDDYLNPLTDERVRNKHILELEGLTLWLVHVKAYHLISPWWQSRALMGQDKYDIPDIVVFGHEHRTFVECLNGILFVSPGSPTFLHYRRGLGTVGILDIDSGEADVHILQL